MKRESVSLKTDQKKFFMLNNEKKIGGENKLNLVGIGVNTKCLTFMLLESQEENLWC